MTKCPYCEAGWPVHRWDHYDGTGSWRTHKRGRFPDEELHTCAHNSWVSRHRFCTAFIVFGVIAVLTTLWNLN